MSAIGIFRQSSCEVYIPRSRLIALLTASWPFLLMPLVGYTVFKALIHTEDEYLQNRFGQSYSKYRASVNEIIPIPRLHDRTAAHR